MRPYPLNATTLKSDSIKTNEDLDSVMVFGDVDIDSAHCREVTTLVKELDIALDSFEHISKFTDMAVRPITKPHHTSPNHTKINPLRLNQT